MRTFIPSGHITGPIMPRFLLTANLSMGAKFLYTILCDYAREKDHCWPSRKTLAKILQCGLTALRGYFRELETAKLIKNEFVNGFVKRIYLLDPKLALTNTVSSDSDTPRTESDTPHSDSNIARAEIASPPSHSDTTLSDSAPKMNGNKNTNLLSSTSTSSPNPQVVSRATEAGADRKRIFFREDEFEEFWNAYPRKISKFEAMSAWRRLAQSKELPPVAFLLEKLELFKASHDWIKRQGHYIPSPAKFLNFKRWLDNPTPDTAYSFSSPEVIDVESNRVSPQAFQPSYLNRNEQIFQSNIATVNRVLQRREQRSATNVA